MFTVSHIVDAVQVALSCFIIHVLAFGLNYLDGVMAEENLTRWPAENVWKKVLYSGELIKYYVWWFIQKKYACLVMNTFIFKLQTS